MRSALFVCAVVGIASPVHAADSTLTLASGQQAKIEGHTRPDGTFDAQQVVVRDFDRTVKVEGRVTAVSDDRRRLQIVGFDITVSRETSIYRGSQVGGSRGLLATGAWIEARGQWRGSVIEAERLRVKDAPETTEELEAVIERVEPGRGSLVMLGRRIRLPEGVQVVDERRGDKPEATRLRRDVDDQARHPIQIGDRVVVGGRLETSLASESNADLDETQDRQREWFSRLQLLSSAALPGNIEAYAKVAFSRSAVATDLSATALGDLRVQEAYLIADRIGGGPLGVQVGRQRFRDSREWFFDEYMDAARVRATFPTWTIEGAVADGLFAGDPAVRSRRDKRQWLLSGTRYFESGPRVSAFVIRRDDRGPSDDDPMWVGSLAELRDHSSGWSAWSLAAVRRGARAGAPLAGWAVDAGATFRLLDATAQPSVTVGFARASGDAVSGDGRDTTFRQTALEDNSARFGGFRRLAYYGALFDPELSNLQVLTVGLGARPSRSVGLDLVGHRYTQATPRSSLPSSRFEDRRTNGRDTGIGHELDGLLTLRTSWGVDLDVSAGVFVSGPAFGINRRASFFFRPQVRFYF